ncbi:MAG: hypothetical protein R3276_16220 [Marinobacter sp.]|nr:hypothetical protein [Marinobacter sp.]
MTKRGHWPLATGLMLCMWTTTQAYGFESLGDGELSAITGQAGITIEDDANFLGGTAQSGGTSGLTIELATKVDIGQIRYVDDAPLDINHLWLSGHNGSMLDNLKITLDVAGDGEVLDYGFSELARRGDQGVLDSSNPDVAAAMAAYSVGGDYGRQYEDGDLVIHVSPLDSGDPASIADYLYAVDFELGIDSVVTGGNADSTTMFSNILLQGYLGPTDITVRNAADETRILSSGTAVSGSELQISSHFLIDNGRVEWEVGDVILLFNLAAVGIEGLQIHNRRGDDMNGHFNMASVNANLSAGTSGTSGIDGLSIHDVEFRADIDMPVFRVGQQSIGAVHFTDFAITDSSMLVYGH